MTDKELSAAIARKLGWKDIPPIPGREHLFDGYMLKPDAKSESDIEKVPDFCGSLDAIKPVTRQYCEKADILFLDFIDCMEIVHRQEEGEEGFLFHEWLIFTASAKSYARAFAYTTGILPVAGKEVEG